MKHSENNLWCRAPVSKNSPKPLNHKIDCMSRYLKIQVQSNNNSSPPHPSSSLAWSSIYKYLLKTRLFRTRKVRKCVSYTNVEGAGTTDAYKKTCAKHKWKKRCAQTAHVLFGFCDRGQKTTPRATRTHKQMTTLVTSRDRQTNVSPCVLCSGPMASPKHWPKKHYQKTRQATKTCLSYNDLYF